MIMTGWTKLGSDKYTICPHCYKGMEQASILTEQNSRRGYYTRIYYCSCKRCKTGFEVHQFRDLNSDKWHLHKYRPYSRLEGSNIEKQWYFVEPLPEPAPVMLGPGGDFDEKININQTELFKKLFIALKSTIKVVEELLGKK
jgi:hypothetical protein